MAELESSSYELRRPKTGTCCSALVKSNLWSDVIWGPTEGPGGRAFKYALFAHAEVCQLTVTIFVQKNVVQFEIPEWKEKKIFILRYPNPAKKKKKKAWRYFISAGTNDF